MTKHISQREAHEWQPIQTAPKDGREIVLAWIPNWPKVEHKARARWEPQRNGWSLGYIDATHWKPVAPIPKGESK